MARPCCGRCRRPLSHCLCALIPDLENRVPVTLLQHPAESDHALNTARLVHLALQRVRLLQGELFPSEFAPGAWLLFPGPDARTPDQLPAGTVRELVVLDGTWRKVRRILHLNPALAALPRIALPETSVSRYRIRKTSVSGGLSTVEAVVEVLNGLEGRRDFDALLRPFEALIEQQIQAMGEAVYRRNYPSR